jgi:hypothetical protein
MVGGIDMASLRLSRWAAFIVIVTMLVALTSVLSRAEAAQGTIAYGQTVSGKLNNQSYFDLWQFQGNRGDRVTILMQGDGNLDPYVGLIDGATQEVLAEDDDSAGNGNPAIETTLSAAGTYVIVATRYGFDTGTTQGQYTLSLSGGTGPQNVSNTTTTTGPQMISEGVYYMGDMVMETPVQGTIDSNSYAQVYTLQADQGTDLLVAMFADSSALDSYVIFANSDGDVLAEDDNSGSQVGGSTEDAFLRLTIPQTGAYLVIATRAGVDQGMSSGAYQLVAGVPQQQQTPQQQTNQLPEGVELMDAVTAGGTATGQITNASFAHLYPFDGNAGDQITITMTGSGGLDAYLGIIDPKQEVIAEDDDSGGGTNAQISIRLPESGTYFIIATRNGIDQGTSVGSYTLTVTSGLPPAPEGVTGVGGFGGLPGRAFKLEDQTFYLRGFGRSDNPEKATPLQQFFRENQKPEALPGRSFHIGGSDTFYLRGSGKSTDPAKASPLEQYLASFLGH